MFITFEGIDGVGKSTQLDMLEKHLIAQGREVVRTLEPGGTDLGQEIRHLLLHRKEMLLPGQRLFYMLLIAPTTLRPKSSRRSQVAKLSYPTATLIPQLPTKAQLGSWTCRK